MYLLPVNRYGIGQGISTLWYAKKCDIFKSLHGNITHKHTQAHSNKIIFQIQLNENQMDFGIQNNLLSTDLKVTKKFNQDKINNQNAIL